MKIVLVLFPDSSLRTAKRRPALIEQADGLGTQLPQVVAAMITSNMARAGHPSRVVVLVGGESAKGSGLLMSLWWRMCVRRIWAGGRLKRIDRLSGHNST